MDSLLTLEELLMATGGQEVSANGEGFSRGGAGALAEGQGESGVSSRSFAFSSVATDSRQVKEGSLFVPLVGENQDGHKYIAQAIEKGAAAVLASKSSRAVWENMAQSRTPCVIIEVDNTLRALQKAAAAYVDKVEKAVRLIKIGITGSNGKTTTKEMAAAVLRKKYRTLCTQGNLNSETGVPLSAFSLLKSILPDGGGECSSDGGKADNPPYTTNAPYAAVFEMGMNRVDEIGESTAVVRPNIAIITNIGTAHIGILGSRDAIAKEKKKIFSYADVCFIPYNDDYNAFLREGIKGKIIEFGRGAAEGVTRVRDCGLDGQDILIGKEQCHLSLPGMHNYYNAAAAAALGRYMGICDKDIADALAALRPMEGRNNAADAVLQNGAAVRIVRDYYNANPQSMAAALDVCKITECRGKRIYVLGDMKEGDGEMSHRELGRLAAAAGAGVLIFVGSDARYAYEEAKTALAREQGMSAAGKQGMDEAIYFAAGSDEDAMQKVSSIILDRAREGDLILLKASRSLMLERVEEMVTRGEG